eukprot:1514463-Amphidinium_carterae.2
MLSLTVASIWLSSEVMKSKSTYVIAYTCTFQTEINWTLPCKFSGADSKSAKHKRLPSSSSMCASNPLTAECFLVHYFNYKLVSALTFGNQSA